MTTHIEWVWYRRASISANDHSQAKSFGQKANGFG